MIGEGPLISIIVPIYNAEDYLFDCLSSITSQTYENFEAILINDGSTDNSYNVAQSFVFKDSRFKLISQANAGVAAAREVGLRAAKGDFVIHADSDDLMTEKALEYLYQSILENQTNIAVGAYIDKKKKEENIVTHSFKDKSEFIIDVLTGKYHGSLCNKLISMELCKDINFEEGLNYMEDKLFLLKVLAKKNAKVSITNKVVYVYNYIEGSYTTSISPESIDSSIRVTDKLCGIFSEFYDDGFINHLKNRNKVMVLLNSNRSQRKVFPDSFRFLFSDVLLSNKHKFILILDFFYLNFIINFYRKMF